MVVHKPLQTQLTHLQLAALIIAIDSTSIRLSAPSFPTAAALKMTF